MTQNGGPQFGACLILSDKTLLLKHYYRLTRKKVIELLLPTSFCAATLIFWFEHDTCQKRKGPKQHEQSSPLGSTNFVESKHDSKQLQGKKHCGNQCAATLSSLKNITYIKFYFRNSFPPKITFQLQENIFLEN